VAFSSIAERQALEARGLQAATDFATRYMEQYHKGGRARTPFLLEHRFEVDLEGGAGDGPVTLSGVLDRVDRLLQSEVSGGPHRERLVKAGEGV
jgi:RecB family exonuclease